MQNFVEIYAPLEGRRLEKVKAFLKSMGLEFGTDAEFTAVIEDEAGNVLATGSLSSNVLKYIAVSDSIKGDGACASLVSELVTKAYNMGRKHLFLYTKPKNREMFSSLGFYEVVSTESVLMMENKKHGLDEFLESIVAPKSGKTGAVVANCNPFTKGHLYLIEEAASRCDILHLFIVSEDRSYFKSEVRYNLAKEAVSHLPNVYVHRSENYLVSHATFPTYFIKEKASVNKVQADLDLMLFATRIAPALNITTRFVGTEPFCEVTRFYNERMKAILPENGIEVVELERKDGISASRVREAIMEKDFEAVHELVPESVYEYIIKNNN